jgi:small subunit ribosomal protein S2
LQVQLEGIRNMERLPDMLFVVDVCEEETAVREANILNIPVVALVDTNCNPLNVDYVIPANDDAVRSIRLLSGKIADAVLEGKAMRKEEEAAAESAAARAAAKAAVERVRVAPTALLDEEELEDEELLGESTLAKIGPRKVEPDEEAEEEEEI